MGLTRLAIEKYKSSILLLVTLLIFGVASISGFKMAYMPDISAPMYFVTTIYNGADPDIIDKVITDPIEDIGSSIDGFKTASSTSTEGQSMVTFEFDYDVDSDQTYMDIKTAVDQLSLPADAMTPIIMQMSTDAAPVMSISVTGSESSDVSGFVNDIFEPKISALSDVAQTNVVGGDDTYVSVRLDQEALNEYNVTMSTVASAITSTDFSIPAGNVDQGDLSISLSSDAESENLQQLKDIPITTPAGKVITVSDVAYVVYAAQNTDQYSRYDGVSNIGIDVSASQDANVPDVAADVNKIIDEMSTEYPEMDIVVAYSSADQIIASLISVGRTLLIGVILCMIVLFLFFGDFRASLIVGSSIPISLFITLLCMRVGGFELNTITTSALVLAIGMMVDNAIVVLESVFRSKEGRTFADAAITGCKAVGTSVTASTITTVVVYLPLIFMGGISGQMFTQMGSTIVFAMVASLISAVTFVPLFYFLFKPVEKETAPLGGFLRFLRGHYEGIVRNVMLHRYRAVAIAALALIGAFGLVTQMDTALIAPLDDGSMKIEANMRPGTRAEVVNDSVADIEQDIANDDRVDNYTVSIDGENATFVVNLLKSGNTDEVIDEYSKKYAIRKNMEVSVASNSLTASFTDKAPTVSIFGGNYEDVMTTSGQLESQMLSIPGVVRIEPDGGTATTKAKIEINPLKAANYGLTSSNVAAMIRMTSYGSDANTIDIDNTEYDITVEYPEGEYDDLNSIMEMPLSTANGQVSLSDIATLEFSDSSPQISRIDGIYHVDLEAVCAKEDSAAVQSAMTEMAESAEVIPGVTAGSKLGDSDTQDELMSFLRAILIAIYLVFLVMAVQFESPKHSLMVMTSIVFSFIGSFGLMFITGLPLTMTAAMGLLMLMGITVNNGILFVDTAHHKHETMEIHDALVETGKERMRPILMTTMTTIFSMVPMALALDADSSSNQSMGVIIIGGLVTSTILVLILMPAFYLILDRTRKPQDKKSDKPKHRFTPEPKIKPRFKLNRGPHNTPSQ